MQVHIKLFGGLTCENQNLELKRILTLKLHSGATIGEIHKILDLSSEKNLVNIVDGHAQMKDYIVDKDCTISIFPPMSNQ